MALESKIICVALLIMGVWASLALSRTLHEVSVSEGHEEWMARYGRTYKDIADKERRFNIFKDNVEYIESVNSAGNRRYKLSINEFADQTNEEFRASRNGYKMYSRPRSSSETTSFRYENVEAVPTSMDWRKKGAVTPIKDQGQCSKALNYISSLFLLIQNGRFTSFPDLSFYPQKRMLLGIFCSGCYGRDNPAQNREANLFV